MTDTIDFHGDNIPVHLDEDVEMITASSPRGKRRVVTVQR